MKAAFPACMYAKPDALIDIIYILYIYIYIYILVIYIYMYIYIYIYLFIYKSTISTYMIRRVKVTIYRYVQ